MPSAFQGQPDSNKLTISGRIVSFCLGQTFGVIFTRMPLASSSIFLLQNTTYTKIRSITYNTSLQWFIKKLQNWSTILLGHDIFCMYSLGIAGGYELCYVGVTCLLLIYCLLQVILFAVGYMLAMMCNALQVLLSLIFYVDMLLHLVDTLAAVYIKPAWAPLRPLVHHLGTLVHHLDPLGHQSARLCIT